MEESKSCFNIMILLAQSVAKINAMDDLNVKKRKLDTETVAIVYHYLREVSPSIASTLLDIHPDADMDCNITLEEVVQQEWKRMADEATAQSLFKYKNEVHKTDEISKHFLKRKGLKDNHSN